jgi:ABC-type uncharacterized transport system substrate-binding protein
MKRRDFIAGLGSALAWPRAASAQPLNSRVSHIAYFGGTSPSALDPRQIEQFKRGLTDNGLIESTNITVEYLWAEGSHERLTHLAADLAGRDLDLIVTAGPQPVRALLAAKVQAPIVFAIYTDPIADGIVDSLARPGKNITGLSMADSHLESKRLEILKDAIAGLKRIAILHDPTSSASELVDARTGASNLGLEALIFEAGDPAQFEDVFAKAADEGANGLAATASPFLNFHHRKLIELAGRYSLPSIWESSGYVRDGGLLSYGPSFPDMYRRAAGYVARVLRGAKASELPVEQPIKFEFAVNLETAKSLGVTIPGSLLARADEVIE